MDNAETQEWAELIVEGDLAGLRCQALMMASLLRALMDRKLLTGAEVETLVAECVSHSLLQAAYASQAPVPPHGGASAELLRVEDNIQQVAVLLRRVLGLKMS